MAAKFDPYYRWLAIPPEEQPPNYYRLLGVKPFETNEDVISAAVDQRMMHLRSFQTGPHAADSQRLLNEVSHASRTLLDPDDRRRYDAQLRSGLAARGPTLGAATVFSETATPASNLAATVGKLADESNDLTLLVEDLTVAPVQEVKTPPAKAKTAKTQVEELPDLSTDLYELEAPMTHPASAAAPSPLTRPSPLSRPGARSQAPAPPENRIHPAIWAAAGCGGLLVLYLILSAMVPAMDVFGMFHDSTEPSPIVASNDPPQRKSDAGDDKKKQPPSANGEQKKSIEAPVKNGSQPNTDQKSPEVKQKDSSVEKTPDTASPSPKVKQNEPPTPTAKPVELKFPREVELPAIKSAAPMTLGTIPESVMITGLRLFADAARLNDDEYFIAAPEENVDTPMKWRVHLARLNTDERTRPAVAEFTRIGELIHFRWLPEAASEPKAQHLSNAALLIETTDSSPRISLRKAQPSDAITLDLQKATVLRELKLASLPRTENLFFQIGGLTALPVTARLHEEVSEIPQREQLTILFPAPTAEQRPEIRVSFEVVGADKVVITGKPVLVTPQGEVPWTMDRLMTQKASAVKALDTAKRSAKIEDGKLPALKKQHDAKQRKSKGAKGLEKTRAENEMFDLQREMESIINAREEHRKQAEASQRVVDTFPELEKTTKALHNAGKLEFRLFARTPDADIELMRTADYR